MFSVFVVSIAFCLYTYLVFPLVLHWRVSRIRSVPGAPVAGAIGEQTHCQSEEAKSLPPVSIVIAVHNEARHLPAKLASLAALNYPTHLLECIFVSDGSTDTTLSLLTMACTERENWHVEHYAQAAGKPTALNLGVSLASGEIIIFMDARQSVSTNAVCAMVNRLQTPSVGAVSGELVLTNNQGNEAGDVGLYWRYEKWIRENESRLFSTTGATGALYAIRKKDYPVLRSDALLDDFEIPISLLRQGKRTVFEPSACAYDRPEEKVSGEFRRKARTLAGNFQSFSRHPWMFNPWKNPVWWQFVSHKVFRLMVPYALMAALLSSVLGSHEFLRVMLAAQLIFYVLGVMGMLGVSNRITSFVSLFVQLNAAAVVGAFRATFGGSAVQWKSL